MWPAVGSWHAWPSRCGECRSNDPAPEVFTMATRSSFPPPQRLQPLLHRAPAAPDQAELIAHLDHCTPCQRALDELAGADPGLLEAVNSLQRTLHGRDARLRHVLADLEKDPALTGLHTLPSSARWVL